MKNEIITVKDLCFRYPGQIEEALSGISFSIERGDFTGLIGPNGSGKTTLIKTILGILKPTRGTIELFGTDIHSFKEWSKIGYVPQNITGLDSNFPANVFEIVQMGLVAKRGLFRMHHHGDALLVNRALELVGMQNFASRRLSQLSGGQQQRVLIARALASNPEVLILDEPTAEVDVHAQRGFYQLLKKLNTKLKITIILISHDIGLVTKMANRVVCVNKTLLCHGTPATALRKIEHLFEEKHVIKHAHHD